MTYDVGPIGSAFLAEYFRGTAGCVYVGAIRNSDSKLQRGEIAHIVGRGRSNVDAFITAHDKPEHEVALYFCTGTLRAGHTERSKDDCQEFVSLFADTDDHNHELDRDRVIAAFESCECPPTMIISSGHGLQPHWLLAEPCEDAERIIAARKRLHALTASDAVHDAPRFMRLPGSHNSKRGDWLLVETVSYHPERRYALEVLEDWLDEAATIVARKPKPHKKGNGHAAHFEMPPQGTGTDRRRGTAWAAAALAASAAELASAGEGRRHNTLLAKACRQWPSQGIRPRPFQ
jgi:hypothetical protein